MTITSISGKRESLNRRAGFTLTELLIVVVIIGVLASLAIPRFMGQTQKAKAMEAVNIMSAVRKAMLHYYDDAGEWPGNLNNQPGIEETLGINFTSPQGWTIRTAAQMIIAEANQTITGGSGNITLDSETGQWGGTDDYNPDTGKYWPHLEH